MSTIQIPDDWLPTAPNVNALPAPLRRYIHDLEALCDPAGIVAQNALIMDQNRALADLVGRLRAQIGIDC